MSRPMNSNRINAQERILEAAVQLFADQGFRGTSTRDISRLAGITDTSLFRYFPRKEDLFWAAVESRLKRLQVGAELQAGLAEGARPEIVVPLIMELIVSTVASQPELIRLLNIGYMELRPRMEQMYKEYLAPILGAISKYLAGQTADPAGTSCLRRKDPYITTAALAATVLAHAGLYQLLTGKAAPYASTNEAVAAYSVYWLDTLVAANHS